MGTETKSKAELALALGRAMAELRALTRQRIQIRLRDHGISLTFEMLEVMSCLWQKDGVNQQEIADYTLRDKSSMTYLLDNLTKRGFVRRVPDGNDRRNKRIYVTAEGEKFRNQLYPWAAEAYEAAATGVDEPTLGQTLAVVNQMVTRLKKL